MNSTVQGRARKYELTLPLFIHKQNRLLMAVFVAILFFFGYSIPNHFHIFEPQQIPMTALDHAVPFMPWTIIIYMSEYLMFVLAYFQFNEEANRNKYIWAFIGQLFVSSIFFILFPTTYPRGAFPLPTDLHPFVYNLFAFLRTLDNPSNCFPSMHVSSCYLTAFAFMSKSESRRKFLVYLVWATLVAMSTLPTKQHYFADVIGGFCLSMAAYWVFFKVAKYESLERYIERLGLRQITD